MACGQVVKVSGAGKAGQTRSKATVQLSIKTHRRVVLDYLKPRPARHIDSGMFRDTSAWRQTNTSMPCSSRIVRILSVSLSSVLAGYAPAITCPRMTQLHHGVGPAILAGFLGKAGSSDLFCFPSVRDRTRLLGICWLLLSGERIRVLPCYRPVTVATLR